MGRDLTEIECAGCGKVMASQKMTIETSWHYNKRTGDLWHLECWEVHKAFLDTLGPITSEFKDQEIVEMLLFKLPMDVYQEVMAYQHHERPLEEAEKVKVQMENLQGRDSHGKSLLGIEGEGFGSIDQQPNRIPVFHG